MNKDKKIAVTPFNTSPSPSSSPIMQNRFVPLSPYTKSQPRPTYSALTQIPTINQNFRPSPTKESSTSSSSTPEFHINPNKEVIKILEPFEERKLDQGFSSLINYIYPQDSHFYNNDYQTRQYYEAILTETRSAAFYHTYNTVDKIKIDFSKVKIFKVLTLEEWGNKPYTNKVLASFPEYPVYNYYDYQEAWNKAFLLRSHTHTWFFRFSEDFGRTYPKWFVKWYKYKGCIPEVFPKSVLQGYMKYKELFHQEGAPPFEYGLQFMIIFNIPWILSFTYKKQEAEATSPPLLLRQFSVKWWKQVTEDQADVSAVINYHNRLTKKVPSPVTSPSMTDDASMIRRIQNCKSPGEIQKILNEVRRSPSVSEEVLQDSQDPYEDVDLFNF